MMGNAAFATNEDWVFYEPGAPDDYEVGMEVRARENLSSFPYHAENNGIVMTFMSPEKGLVGVWWPGWERGHNLDGRVQIDHGGWWYPWSALLIAENLPQQQVSENLFEKMDDLF